MRRGGLRFTLGQAGELPRGVVDDYLLEVGVSVAVP
jgi:hypothetical protein